MSIYLGIGRRGQGKTTLAWYIARRSSPRRIVLDPRGLIRPAGAVLVTRISDIAGAIKKLSMMDRGTVVITPVVIDSGFAAVCAELAKWLRKEPQAGFVFLIDEFRFVKRAAMSSPEFEWLLRCSNPERVNIIITCHRPVDIPVDVRSIADHWLMFRMTQAHDLKVVEERSVKAAQRVQRLDPRVYVHFDDSADESSENPATFSQPDVWFVPLRSAETGEPDDGSGLELEPDPAENDGLLPLE